jgi:hypothetical protein
MPDSAATVYTLAAALEAAFISDTRTNGETFYKLRDDSPEWLSDAIFVAHDRTMPDDWRYSAIRAVAGEIAESEDDTDPDESDWERCVSLVDCYTARLTAWLGSRVDRAAYCDDAADEYGWPTEGGIIKLLQMGQSAEYREIWGLLWTFLSERADELESGQ